MKNLSLLIVLLLLGAQVTFAQNDKDTKEKKTVKEKLEALPDMLIAQPDNPADTFGDKIVSNNLYIKVHPLWREKGAMILNDYKLNKTNEEPLDATLPVPDKKIAQSIVINLNTVKKNPADVKAQVMAQVKKNLIKYYKDAGQSISGKDLDDKVNSMIVGSDKLTTAQGKQGEVYYINDIQSQQSGFIMLYVIPGDAPGTTIFVQFEYFRYIYETEFPEDIMEWRCFIYPDEQQAYIDFTKKIMQTLMVK